MCHSREETHHKRQKQERYPSEIDEYSPPTEVEGAVQQWLLAHATKSHCADGNEVGRKQGRDAEGQDLIECHGRADIDEREEDGECDGEVDGWDKLV
jgi:hypothetical protein